MILRGKILKSKAYRVVLWIILFSMAGGSLLFSPFFKKTTGGVPVLLNVNGNDITHNDFRQKLMQEMENIALLRQQYGASADILLPLFGLDKPEEKALQNLVIEELLYEVAQKLSIDFSSDYVMQKLQDPSIVFGDLRDSIPLQAIDQQGKVNLALLKMIAQRRGQSIGDIEVSIEKALARKMVLDLVSLSVYSSPNMLRKAFSDSFLKKKYALTKLSFNDHLKKAHEQDISNEEIKSFFTQENAASKKYWVPEKRVVTTWSFVPRDFGVEVSEKEIEDYYEKNKAKEFLSSPVQVQVRSIMLRVADEASKEKAMQRAQDLHKELFENPSSFEQLAKTHSEDEKTAGKGGLMPYFKRGEHDANFERAAFRLKNAGDISDVVVTKDSIYILQLVDRKASTYKPLDSVKNDIQKKLNERLFKKEFQDQAQRVEKEGEEALRNFIQKKSAQQEKHTLEKGDSALQQKAFKLKKDSFGSLVSKEGLGMIVRVDEVQKSYEPSLAEVEKLVKNDLYQKKAQELLAEAVRSLQEKSKEASFTLEDFKKFAQGQVIETDWLQKDMKDDINKLKKQEIPVEELLFKKNAQKGSMTSIFRDGDAYVAYCVEVENFNQDLFDEKKTLLEQELFNEQKELATSGFIASLYRNAKIEKIELDKNANPFDMILD